ncbi:MAG: isoaspartyl peptidase/L-asparaginase [Acidobacteria bacterium]|nr:isoaspartyl peptidase/L-asparaginase [Acidobacteriota bacterium]MBI3662166.1 isoaspartyl peptidase/L-asparaginase [Acidobacteriota bacterium]
MPNSCKPSLIVHGGAWAIPDEAVAAVHAGCRRALEAGREILERGGAAMDAVEAAIIVLEDDPTFDAGTGSHLNRDGRVQLDAIVMDGSTLEAGAVAAVERVRNPIRLARKVMESCEHMMLVGAGAEQFAAEQGLPLCQPEELIHEREKKAWGKCMGGNHLSEFHFSHQHGTVGAVARDAQGRIVAGTSTGGTCCKRPGRVGDSPLIGCGCYADAEAGGVSCTGWGEAIMKVVLAKSAADFLRSGQMASQAAQAAVELLARRTKGTGGLILLDRDGIPGFAFSTPHMAYGYVAPDGSIVTAV